MVYRKRANIEIDKNNINVNVHAYRHIDKHLHSTKNTLHASGNRREKVRILARNY